MKAYAYVNHSRWVVECPRGTCHDATIAKPGSDPYRCQCNDTIVCDHGTPCGQQIEPIYPRHFRAISEVLKMRPDAANRNWWPGETTAQLEAENIEHGVGVS